MRQSKEEDSHPAGTIRSQYAEGYLDEVICKVFSATLKGSAKTCSLKGMKSLKDYIKRFNQAVFEVEDANDKVVVMAMMEGLCPSPLFDSLSRNVFESYSVLQSKTDKYIAVEELVGAKRRRR
ncbi:hypothetical protein Acr_08g0011200 [Actinidia rufa]|uniref:Retrotransposon gag domain-containing protein n=1 Tax=Actinidia rufa TaxID=165716 RepID=A0A7J0F219_9ERIC|nr:hypothetical protein Acr_08g0011200 [Actinidia rufa]